jgi:signal transduction histidine kinase/FixJ family two-component response regulator
MTSYANHLHKTKIWSTFFIIIIVAFTAVFLSYFSYQKLISSIEILSEPDEKIELIQNTIQRLTKADNYFQSYIISNKSEMYQAYHHEVESIQSNLEKLRNKMSEGSLQIQKVDSLDILFQQKLSFLNDFLKIKKMRQTKNYSNEALEIISNNTADNLEMQSEVRTTFQAKEIVLPRFEKIPIERTYKEPGFWGGIKRLFVSSNILVDTMMRLTNDTIYGIEVKVDTLILTNYASDTNLIKVKEILQEVANREFESQFLLTSKELKLLRQDQRLFEEIDKIMQQIRQHEQDIASKRRSESYLVAHNSTKVIVIIGTLGILLVGGFLLIIGRDFTHSYRLSKRLEDEKNKAKEHARIKEEFLANMSHEIRTPLNSIVGYSDLLGKSPLDQDQHFYTQAISRNTKYLFDLVNDVLDFSKLNVNKTKLESAPFSLKETINQIMSLFSIQIEQKGLQFNVSFNQIPEDLYLIGDEFRIKQIISNLLNNSLKFTEKGFVELSLHGRQRFDRFFIYIHVTDTGKGIEPDKFSSIFNSFEQEDITITKKYGGTGLGLSIVKNLVEAMNGKITVASKPGVKTTFTVKLALPFRTADVESYKNDNKHKEINYFDSHIVLIEDDHWNITLLKKLLEPRVNKLSAFKQPEDALEFIKKEYSSIELVITDISMPNLSGIDVLNFVKSVKTSIPVVAVTAHAIKSKVLELQALGFQDVIIKPFNEVSIYDILVQNLHVKSKASANGMAEEMVNGFNTVLDFASLRKITANDPKLMEELIIELKNCCAQNVEKFKLVLGEKNHRSLFEIAHKMTQSYDSMYQVVIVEALKEIELFYRMNKYDQMISRAEKLIPALEEINGELRNIKFQSCI